MKKSTQEIVRRTRGRDTTAELLARGFDIDGTAGDDTPIEGTNTTDRINGYGGNVTLIGLNGTDTLLGGDGNDRMRWRTRSENISKKTAANDEATYAWRVAA